MEKNNEITVGLAPLTFLLIVELLILFESDFLVKEKSGPI